jgi:uncharacterized membrane protein
MIYNTYPRTKEGVYVLTVCMWVFTVVAVLTRPRLMALHTLAVLVLAVLTWRVMTTLRSLPDTDSPPTPGMQRRFSIAARLPMMGIVLGLAHIALSIRLRP